MDSLRKFIKTPAGKAVAVVVPTALAAIVLAVLALGLLKGGSGPEVESTSVEATKTAEADGQDNDAESTATADAEVDASEASETVEATGTYPNENFETYETRDPFKVFDASTTIDGTPITGPVGSGAVTTSPSQTLTLKSIESDESDVLYANVTYGATPYLVKEGERVGSSPYEALTITNNNATFLFGDDQVVLSIGDSVDK